MADSDEDERKIRGEHRHSKDRSTMLDDDLAIRLREDRYFTRETVDNDQPNHRSDDQEVFTDLRLCTTEEQNDQSRNFSQRHIYLDSRLLQIPLLVELSH